MAEPFRVLLIDDETGAGVKNADGSDIKSMLSGVDQIAHAWPLVQLAAARAEGGPEVAGIETYLSKDAALRAMWQVEPQVRRLDLDDDQALELLRRMDVVIIDLMDVMRPRDAWGLTNELVPDKDHRDRLNTRFGGAAFYLALRERMADYWQAAVILTAGDKEGSADPLLRRYLYPWTNNYDARPWTVVYSKYPDGATHVAELVLDLYRGYSRNYWQLNDRGAIEFAASHDEPVLIVGETGTGKEYVAKAIFERWNARLQREGSGARKLEIVNCGGLLSQLARSELFGHVRGAFTGAEDHNIGKILAACGVGAIRSDLSLPSADYKRIKSAVDDFAKLNKILAQITKHNEEARPEEAKRLAESQLVPMLKEVIGASYDVSVLNAARMVVRKLEETLEGRNFAAEFREKLLENESVRREADGSLSLVGQEPLGMLFLDEFGDLAPDVQRTLLRFLESYEVEPLGYPGRILNARVRVIAATSDPRIARFVGERLYGSWRTREELERPLREDLLFRLKGYVIRVEPINTSNAERFVRSTVERAGGENWDSEAIAHLTELVKAQAQEVEAHSENLAPTNRPPSFGHRREIRRIVTLANAFVHGAIERGMRGVSQKVTSDVVDHIWKPSRVDLLPAGAGAATPVARSEGAGPPRRSWKLGDCSDGRLPSERRVKERTLLYSILTVLYDDMDNHGNGFSREELARAVSAKIPIKKQSGKTVTPSAIANRVSELRNRLHLLQKENGCDLDIPLGQTEGNNYRLVRLP